MNKNQQLLLGVGVVGLAAFLYHKSKQPKANYGGGVLSPRMRNLAGNAKVGRVQPLGSNSFGKRGFANQKLSGDAKFAKAEGGKQPFFQVKGAHVGTPALWS